MHARWRLQRIGGQVGSNGLTGRETFHIYGNGERFSDRHLTLGQMQLQQTVAKTGSDLVGTNIGRQPIGKMKV